MLKITCKLVDKPLPRLGNIIVICDDNEVHYVNEYRESNKNKIDKIIHFFESSSRDFYFLNFSREAFFHYMKKAINNVKEKKNK